MINRQSSKAPTYKSAEIRLVIRAGTWQDLFISTLAAAAFFLPHPFPKTPTRTEAITVSNGPFEHLKQNPTINCRQTEL